MEYVRFSEITDIPVESAPLTSAGSYKLTAKFSAPEAARAEVYAKQRRPPVTYLLFL